MSDPGREQVVIDLVGQVKALVPALNAVLAEVFRPLGLTCVQADALMALAEHQPVTLGGLAEHLVAESGHPSRLVARLESAGWVRRDPDPRDHRAALLSLTTEGERLAAAAVEARGPLVRDLAARHGDRAAEVLDVLGEVLADLRTHTGSVTGRGLGSDVSRAAARRRPPAPGRSAGTPGTRRPPGPARRRPATAPRRCR